MLTVNPSTSLPKFGVSEWLAAFSFVISFYILVPLNEVVETVTQESQIAWTLNVMLITYIMSYCKTLTFWHQSFTSKF
jgi:hypothetical protein